MRQLRDQRDALDGHAPAGRQGATLGSSGAATLTTSTLIAGSHTITAVYGDDASYLGARRARLRSCQAPGSSTVTVTRPGSGASCHSGRVVRASYSYKEGVNGPGIVSCKGTVPPRGSRIDTRRAGTHTLAVTAVSGHGGAVTDAMA